MGFFNWLIDYIADDMVADVGGNTYDKGHSVGMIEGTEKEWRYAHFDGGGVKGTGSAYIEHNNPANVDHHMSELRFWGGNHEQGGGPGGWFW